MGETIVGIVLLVASLVIGLYMIWTEDQKESKK
jgi:hypothetical protein